MILEYWPAGSIQELITAAKKGQQGMMKNLKNKPVKT